MSAPTVDLPDGIEHGTPEGSAAGCKSETACPAAYTHGLTCFVAGIRAASLNPRYLAAHRRDPRPAAIARALGFTPIHRSTPTMTTKTAPAPTDVAPAAPTPTPEPVEDTAPTAETVPVKEQLAPKRPARKKPTPKPDRTGPTQSVIRAWAKEHGIPVSQKGNIARDVIDAYTDAHSTPPKLTQADPVVQASGDLDSAALTSTEHATIPSAEHAAITPPEQTVTDPPGPRPEWSTVTLDEDLAKAQRLNDDLVRELIALAADFTTLVEKNAHLAALLDQARTAFATTLELLDTAHRARDTALAEAERERLSHEAAHNVLAMATSKLTERDKAIAKLLEANETQQAEIVALRANLNAARPWWKRGAA